MELSEKAIESQIPILHSAMSQKDVPMASALEPVNVDFADIIKDLKMGSPWMMGVGSKSNKRHMEEEKAV